jgi:hypothetical protein
VFRHSPLRQKSLAIFPSQCRACSSPVNASAANDGVGAQKKAAAAKALTVRRIMPIPLPVPVITRQRSTKGNLETTTTSAIGPVPSTLYIKTCPHLGKADIQGVARWSVIDPLRSSAWLSICTASNGIDAYSITVSPRGLRPAANLRGSCTKLKWRTASARSSVTMTCYVLIKWSLNSLLVVKVRRLSPSAMANFCGIQG